MTANDNGRRAAIMDGANPTGCEKEAARMQLCLLWNN